MLIIIIKTFFFDIISLNFQLSFVNFYKINKDFITIRKYQKNRFVLLFLFNIFKFNTVLRIIFHKNF